MQIYYFVPWFLTIFRSWKSFENLVKSTGSFPQLGSHIQSVAENSGDLEDSPLPRPFPPAHSRMTQF